MFCALNPVVVVAVDGDQVMNLIQKCSPLLLSALIAACAETAPNTAPSEEASPTAQLEPVTYTLSEGPAETGLVETITLDGLGSVDKATVKESSIFVEPAPIEPREPCTEQEIADRRCTEYAYSATSVPISAICGAVPSSTDCRR